MAARFVRFSRQWCYFSRGHRFRSLNTRSNLFRVSEEVSDALMAGKPVVALETTIYTHGFSHPENISLATQLETIVRKHGAIPATIGVLHGVARVGFEYNELQTLLGEPGAQKISRKDLGFAIGLGLTSNKLNGGTTISGTAVLAALAGIKVFATGGLGGVHRGGESSLDISADLTELGRTPVALISSGCKGFLDIPRTLEYLETEGVGVATFADGRVGNVDFPAFWSRDSGVSSPRVIQNEADAASIIHAQSVLGLSSGLLFANPVPLHASIEVSVMEQYINEAVLRATQKSVTGSDNTPFILREIKHLSCGKSDIANIALVESNVKRGAIVAVELARLQREENRRTRIAVRSVFPIASNTTTKSISSYEKDSTGLHSKIDVLVAGAIAIDISCNYATSQDRLISTSPQLYTSNPASISKTLGGVAHNVARTAHLLGCEVRLCSIIADDDSGNLVQRLLSLEGLNSENIKIVANEMKRSTALYVSINDAKKNLYLAMADMSIFEQPDLGFFDYCTSQLKETKPNWLVVDANWDATSLRNWMNASKNAGVSVAFEPVSAAKSVRAFELGKEKSLPVWPENIIDLATPNSLELDSMYMAARNAGFFERRDWWDIVNEMGIPATGAHSDLIRSTSRSLVNEGIPQKSIQLLPFMPCILTKLGPQGVLLTKLLPTTDPILKSEELAQHVIARSSTGEKVGGIYMRLFPSPEALSEQKSVNGAGDTFLGTIVAGLSCDRECRVEDIIDVAQRASILTLKSDEAVHPDLGVLKPSLSGYRTS